MLFEVSLFQVIGLTELVRINRILTLIANVDSTVQTLAQHGTLGCCTDKIHCTL